MKHKTCPRCGGYMKAESIGWICSHCHGFLDMEGNFHKHIEKPFEPPMTNADWIRSMSDEELAHILGDKCICPPDKECAESYGNCDSCWLKWLKQPVEVDHESET